MIKRLQNIVAESRYTLPTTVIYGVVVWLLTGLLQQQWWIQFGCFAASVWLMMELNSQNLLVRVFSRMVSSLYIVLSCTAVFLFPSLSGAILQICTIAALCLLYHTYQDKDSMGWIYYAFLCLGLGSLMDIHLFYYLPLFWIIMKWFIYSLSWRTFFASLMGLVTPYWFAAAWHSYFERRTFLQWVHEQYHSFDFFVRPDYSVLTQQQILFLGFLAILAVIGTIHFLLTSYHDKIRVRQLYYSFIVMTCFSGILIGLQPQRYDTVIHMLIITVSPLIAHFITLTHSKISNIVFMVLSVITLLLTGFNIWISSSLF